MVTGRSGGAIDMGRESIEVAQEETAEENQEGPLKEISETGEE
jgi:hypothetical protein